VTQTLRFNLLIGATLAIAGSACDRQEYPAGHFEGSLFARTEGGITESPVSFEISRPDHRQGTIEVRDTAGTLLLRLKVERIGARGFSLTLPAPWNRAVPLVDDSGCYVHAGDPRVSFCHSPDKALLEVSDPGGQPVLTLSGDRFGADTPLVMEAPRALTLADAIQTALGRNFGSRIEFEHLLQARAAARAAYLNLLPHLSLSTALSNLPPSATSLFASIGDVAPFLLPDRWLQARAAAHAAQAQADALDLMRADLATTVEGLAYALIRDEEALALYDPLLDRLTTTLPRIMDLESRGQMLTGSALHVRAIIDSLKLDKIGLMSLLQQDRETMAAALGFHNPEGVLDVSLGDEATTIHTAAPVDAKVLAPIALGRSFELRQIDHLIEAANDSREAVVFNWLDPAGEPGANLGPSLGANLVVARSRVNELMIAREELQAGIAAKVSQAANEWNLALESVGLMDESVSLQAQRLDFVLGEIGSLQLNTLDIEGVVQDCVATGVRRAALVAGFRVARSKVDRLLLQGHYLELQPGAPGL
jgi:hypothetical protein